MIKKDVYNKFREHIALILDYLDNVNEIYEYCKSMIDDIVNCKRDPPKIPSSRALKPDPWWRDYSKGIRHNTGKPFEEF